MRRRLGKTCGSALAICLGILMAGCPSPPPPAGGGGDGGGGGNGGGDGGGDGGGMTVPEAFTNADAARGGALYDKFWSVTGGDAPMSDHPLWADRPDQETNTRTGADTWRCKECHGWDYKGVDGAYASGSHRTGIAGIFGTTATPQEVFDLLTGDHAYDTVGLADEDIWDLAKFVLEGQIDTDDVLDGDMFTGSPLTGEGLYNTACSACHGTDGLANPPGHDDFEEFVGLLSNENPWEFLHKVRFGQPGTIMPAQFDVLTIDEMNDLSAYAQTLPMERP